MPIEITIPGSKSISNRALLLNALTGNKTTLHNIAPCDDSDYMIAGLEELQKPEPKLYTGNAGTSTRFLTAYSTLLEKEIQIDGDERMRERPILALTEALNSLGANVESPNGCPPLTIHAQKLKGGEISIPGDISSQYLSALLMTLPFTAQTSIINIEGELCSKPYIEITLSLLKDYGITIQNKNFQQFTIEAQQATPPLEFTVEGDASSASYIGAYSALHPEKEVKLTNIHKNSIQGDIKFLEYLEKMGCQIAETIKGPQKLQSLGTVDMNSTPDLVMTFAVLALFASNPTTITNVSNLRIKETDRLQALENELKKLGAKVSTTNDSITIHPLTEFPKEEIQIATYNDHRMAMSFAILNDILPIKIIDPTCVSKSYTSFWQDLNKLQS